MVHMAGMSESCGRVELRLPHQDETLSEARAEFMSALKRELQAAVDIHLGALTNEAEDHGSRGQVALLEGAVAEREERLSRARQEYLDLCARRGILVPSLGAPMSDDAHLGATTEPSNQINVTLGDTLAVADGPITDIDVSPFGRFIALACGDKAVLCQSSSVGFRIVASYAPVPGVSLVSVRLFDRDVDTSALVLAVADTCVGWAPLEEPLPAKVAHDAEIQEDKHIFFGVQVTQGNIVVADSSLGSGRFPRELLLLGTDQGTLEMYDLHLLDESQPPSLLWVVRLLSESVICAVIGDGGRVAFAGTTSADDVRMHGLDTSRGSCYCSMQPGVDSLRPKGMPARERLRLAYSDQDEVLAASVAGGLVEVFRMGGSLGSAVVRANAASEELSGDGSAVRATPDIPAPALAWCHSGIGRRSACRPLLAVASRTDAVLLYRYVPGRLTLTLAVSLVAFGDGAPPRALAWSTGLQALLAAYSSEWQFWLLEAKDDDVQDDDQSNANAVEKGAEPDDVDAPDEIVLGRLEQPEMDDGAAAIDRELDKQTKEAAKAAAATAEVDATICPLFDDPSEEEEDAAGEEAEPPMWWRQEQVEAAGKGYNARASLRSESIPFVPKQGLDLQETGAFTFYPSDGVAIKQHHEEHRQDEARKPRDARR